MKNATFKITGIRKNGKDFEMKGLKTFRIDDDNHIFVKGSGKARKQYILNTTLNELRDGGGLKTLAINATLEQETAKPAKSTGNIVDDEMAAVGKQIVKQARDRAKPRPTKTTVKDVVKAVKNTSAKSTDEPKLTEKQEQVMVVVHKLAANCSDGFAKTDDIPAAADMEIGAVRGVLASLSRKKLIIASSAKVDGKKVFTVIPA